jgi:hypothetical protein
MKLFPLASAEANEAVSGCATYFVGLKVFRLCCDEIRRSEEFMAINIIEMKLGFFTIQRIVGFKMSLRSSEDRL